MFRFSSASWSFPFWGCHNPKKPRKVAKTPKSMKVRKLGPFSGKVGTEFFTIFTRTTRAVTKKVPELRTISRICNRINGSRLSSFPDLGKKAQKPQKGAETRKAFLELADVGVYLLRPYIVT